MVPASIMKPSEYIGNGSAIVPSNLPGGSTLQSDTQQGLPCPDPICFSFNFGLGQVKKEAVHASMLISTYHQCCVTQMRPLLLLLLSFEGFCIPLRLKNCLFPVPDSQPTTTQLFQSPLYGRGTVFHSISHLVRHFPSSALT